MARNQLCVALAHSAPGPAEAVSAAVVVRWQGLPSMKQPKPKPDKGGDPLIARMDTTAGLLLDKVQGDGVELRDRLDVFKELARWIAVKKGIDPEGKGGSSIDDFKRRLEPPYGAPHSGAPGHGLAPRVISRHPRKPGGTGGSALDAIKARIPSANPGDDAGRGNGAVSASLSAPISSGGFCSSDDGDDRSELA